MSLRELKNQLLSEIRRRKEYSLNIRGVAISEIDNAELEKDENIASESIQRIGPEEEVQQRLETAEFHETQMAKDEVESPESIHEFELTEDAEESIEVSESVQRIESEEEVKQEFNPAENGETNREGHEHQVPEVDLRISYAKDIKQILSKIVHHLTAESSFIPADLRRTGSSPKNASNFFDKLDVNINSEASAANHHKKETIPPKLKSKFGTIKKWPLRDKSKGYFLDRQSAIKENIHATDPLYKTFIGKSK